MSKHPQQSYPPWLDSKNFAVQCNLLLSGKVNIETKEDHKKARDRITSVDSKLRIVIMSTKTTSTASNIDVNLST